MSLKCIRMKSSSIEPSADPVDDKRNLLQGTPFAYSMFIIIFSRVNDIRPSEKRRESVCLYSTTGCLRRGKQNRIYFTLDVREGKGRNVFELTEQRKIMYFISIQARKSLGKEIEIEKKSFKPR